jgi:hypothetical protein
LPLRAEVVTPPSVVSEGIRASESERLAHTQSPLRRADVCPEPVSHAFRYPATEFSISLYARGNLPVSAERLVESAYSRLGYLNGLAYPEMRRQRELATFHAIHGGRTLGTLAVNLDGPEGLKAEVLYPEEIGRYRSQGRICEFTRLALDRDVAGREVLCALFYMAYVYAHFVDSVAHLFIEVNPRHQAFYARMLGFRRLGDEKLCPRVNAPAVLMHLDFEHTERQIQRAREGLCVTGTTLYRHALPASEERGLIRSMRLAAR